MKHTARMTTAARLGRWLGGVWGVCLRAERRVHQWLVAQGLPAGGATVLVRVVKLAILAVLLYVAVWAALLLVALVVAARMVEQAPQGDDDFLGRKAEELDHRESLFYHPASYNDDPDPRFEDD
ncbi:DUF3742 family protein [Pseudomonas aeruginosa]|uniref:DUF3742 family protein n=1 Tax=Pseudomonas aeruginosa TaxID=287 RepID=UPI001244D611|nr:DUF3742 family protein [Pseudomonas aeruginosa]ELC7284693.1 DUF3742 family protein [Pseudomonas aeruginosa]ELJ2354539.1 DUF3742 family protein [Pseudomonas aeruginosa]KAB0757653.1 DUF3742 family protein [Pseudomonas aeruginosa]MCW5475386.1 DUF3742 family protein [Pseudomonas aeruginosa]MCW5481863.1 DUF3742 family protein [Pseudomonas aeruginosa]